MFRLPNVFLPSTSLFDSPIIQVTAFLVFPWLLRSVQAPALLTLDPAVLYMACWRFFIKRSLESIVPKTNLSSRCKSFVLPLSLFSSYFGCPPRPDLNKSTPSSSQTQRYATSSFSRYSLQLVNNSRYSPYLFWAYPITPILPLFLLHPF